MQLGWRRRYKTAILSTRAAGGLVDPTPVKAHCVRADRRKKNRAETRLTSSLADHALCVDDCANVVT